MFGILKNRVYVNFLYTDNEATSLFSRLTDQIQQFMDKAATRHEIFEPRSAFSFSVDVCVLHPVFQSESDLQLCGSRNVFKQGGESRWREMEGRTANRRECFPIVKS